LTAGAVSTSSSGVMRTSHGTVDGFSLLHSTHSAVLVVLLFSFDAHFIKFIILTFHCLLRIHYSLCTVLSRTLNFICRFLILNYAHYCHFWVTICTVVCPMLSDRCLSVCPVCDIGLLWPNGWMDQNETWLAGRPRPGHIVVDRDPAPPPQKGHIHNFWPMSVVAKRLKMPLSTEVDLDPDNIVLDGDPAPPKTGAQHP